MSRDPIGSNKSFAVVKLNRGIQVFPTNLNRFTEVQLDTDIQVYISLYCSIAKLLYFQIATTTKKNFGPFGANTVVFGGNLVVFGENTVLFGENTCVFGANIVLFGANTVLFGAYTVVFGANKVFSENTVKLGANTVIFGVTKVVFGAKTVVSL